MTQLSHSDTNKIEAIVADHNKAMRTDMASEIVGGSRSKAITDVITVKAIQALITQQCYQARRDEHRVLIGMFNSKTELYVLSNETRMKIKKRQAELRAQAKQTEGE